MSHTTPGDPIEVYPLQTEVLLGHGSDEFIGTILEIAIGPGDHTRYKVVWWDGRARKSEWLTASEFRLAHDQPRRRIGFAIANP